MSNETSIARCQDCGGQIGRNARFCTWCGHPSNLHTPDPARDRDRFNQELRGAEKGKPCSPDFHAFALGQLTDPRYTQIQKMAEGRTPRFCSKCGQPLKGN